MAQEKKSITIPWSADPEENRRNIQAALDAGYTEINGEKDEDGRPKRYLLEALKPLDDGLPKRPVRLFGRSADKCNTSKDFHQDSALAEEC
ncbi:MAG TPA: hypothetical protein VME43_25975 [Bryobacteraceae bacterium]|nr:hypothetical protein [Bryobacteraceae bacterium]